jgi:hypothetical protein
MEQHGAYNLIDFSNMFLCCHVQREMAYQRFRFTSRTTRFVLISCILVPGALLYFSNATHVRPITPNITSSIDDFSAEQTRWDWTGKRKGESLKREP